MDFQDNDEDCTIFIEELKSDDPNLKINAVVKIQQIADILGANRVREELIPYLIEIIEELDNEDEFLIKLAEQILGLKTKVGGIQHTHLLIAPLEILSSMEEAAVREKAVSCLVSLSENQDKQFFTDHFMTMIKQLAGLDNFPSRISACTLLSSCFKYFEKDEQTQLRQVFDQLCKDDTPMVRRIAGLNIQQMVDQLEKNIVQTEIFPLWQKLVQDDVDSVKSMAIESANKLLEKLNNKATNDQILVQIRICLDNKKPNWRIRYGIAEALGQIQSYYDKEVVKKEIYVMFEQLLKDTEQEVRSIALDKLPLICQNLSAVIIANSLLPLLTTIVQDQSYHVRTSLAEVICKIGLNLEKQVAVSGIVPIIETLLKDDVLDVRLMLLQNLNVLNSYIGIESVLQNIMPLFANIFTDKLWRYRLSFTKLIPDFVKQIGFSAFKEQLIKFSKQLLDDHYSAIREQCYINFQLLCKDINYESMSGIIWECTNSLKVKPNYVYRITALQGLLLVKQFLPKRDINEKVAGLIEEMLKDKVANVLICSAKLFLEFKKSFDQQTLNKLTNILEPLKTHLDIDVQYHVQQALN